MNKTLQQKIYEQNVQVGWWNGERPVSTLMILTTSELAEAMDGVRKGLVDDHLPQYPQFVVEVADAAIRTMDWAQHFEIPCTLEPLENSFLQQTAIDIFPACEALWRWNKNLVQVSNILRLGGKLGPMQKSRASSVCQTMLMEMQNYCAQHGYDLYSIVCEKHAYNAQRADHKLENREAEGGKKI